MRHDHTNWLTHFVRDRNPDQDFPGGDEDDCGFFAGGELEIDASAFQVLKTIIRLGGITPGYSFRNGRTTIYGGRPAICVTEMPLYSFATYVKSRGDTAKASAYGIAFLKAEFFTAGGRPVIYGLSTDNPNYKENTTTSRIFCDSVLPLSEQYRYVAFNPSSRTNWIDWSHEREWRWIVQDPDRDHIWLRDYHGVYDTAPGLPLFKGAMEGGAFTRVCVIVWDREEAAEIQELLTGLYLAGSNNYGTPFERNLIAASHIVVLEDVIDAVEKGNKLNSQTIEGLEEANLLEPIKIVQPPANAAQIAASAMATAATAAEMAAKAFAANHGLGGGYCGYANAVTYDVTNPIVQYLLSTGQAAGPYDGAVLIQFPKNFPSSQSMDYNEAVCEAAAKALTSSLGISVFMESRPD